MRTKSTTKMLRDVMVLGTFTELWCQGHNHPDVRITTIPNSNGQTAQLCPACEQFLQYAIERRIRCPLEPAKPDCKHCPIHCYAPSQRALARQIMAWSGRRMLLRGRLDLLWHYLR